MTDLNDAGEVETAARQLMAANKLFWAAGPEWVKVAFGGPPSDPPMIYVIEGRMQSTVSGHSIFIDAGDALWFWQDARNVAFDWHAFEDLMADDRAVLEGVDGQGKSTVRRSAYSHAFDRLEAAGLISTSPRVGETVEVEITLLGRRYLRWGR